MDKDAEVVVLIQKRAHAAVTCETPASKSHVSQKTRPAATRAVR